MEDTLEIYYCLTMNILTFLQHQPKGYQSQIADVTWTNYSRMWSLMAKLRQWKKMNSHEVEILLRGISILEAKDYLETDFQW